ncbi:MAG: DNA topoisomerase IB [Ignavibacteria bacterium]|nr:DNA topoisomerase IB [Ignavibacteria bacterium]MCU7503247.1 DNA topoisomerase IB [Ignavibacteria bacterium]MCU7515807.1 DNA topoisomerase IB [Ignavibacteria bacterium]
MNALEEIINEKLENLIITEPEEVAEAAGLRYVSDTEPGFSRRIQGKGFAYLDKNGNKLTDPKHINRIEALVIPPAWTDVWICPYSGGHIQATGRDQKGRKQYIYHPGWEDIRNTNKFNLMIRFGETLPLIRARVDEDLRRHGLPREKVMAILVRLLEETLIRIGNSEYAKQNDSYGLTTLRNKHMEVEGSKVRFIFKGKSGKQWEVDIENKRLAKLIRQCQELPGQQLFQYLDEQGSRQSVESADVNNYLKEIIGQDFTAKDFRTWGGTVRAARELYSLGPAEAEKDKQKNIVQAIKKVSGALNNTPSVCRKYYIHPEVITAYMDDSLFEKMEMASKSADSSGFGLNAEETAVLNILKEGLLQKEELLNSA